MPRHGAPCTACTNKSVLCFVQITLCEQVQGYLSNYMANDKAAADAAAADKADITPLQGMAIYQKKKVCALQHQIHGVCDSKAPGLALAR